MFCIFSFWVTKFHLFKMKTTTREQVLSLFFCSSVSFLIPRWSQSMWTTSQGGGVGTWVRLNCVWERVCGLVVDHEISTQLFIFLNKQHRNPPQRENLNLSPVTTWPTTTTPTLWQFFCDYESPDCGLGFETSCFYICAHFTWISETWFQNHGKKQIQVCDITEGKLYCDQYLCWEQAVLQVWRCTPAETLGVDFLQLCWSRNLEDL